MPLKRFVSTKQEATLLFAMHEEHDDLQPYFAPNNPTALCHQCQHKFNLAKDDNSGQLEEASHFFGLFC